MIKKVCSLILIFLLSFSISSCRDPKDTYDYYVDGDYVFAYKEFPNGLEKLYLYGLSEEGKQKECIILPKEYNGKKINGFGAELSYFYGGTYYIDDFDSSFLDKIFINFELSYVYDNWFRISGQDPYDGTNGNVNRNKYTFYVWYDFHSRILNAFSFITTIRIFGNNVINDEKINTNLTYNTYGIANVSYIYNYDDAPNGGYYWVDNYDNSLIEYIPPEPTREGYTFDGWYKEEDCINKWDFTSDITSPSYTYYRKPNENSTEEYKEFYNEYMSTHTYVETKLYAKWLKN